MRFCNSMRTTNLKSNRERGSETVEFGLVCVPFFAFILLIMDISWAVFNKAALQHAVREGVRYAVTYQTSGGLGQDASIKAVVQQNAMGVLQSTSLITIQYYTPDTLTPTSSNAAGNIVQVAVNGYGLSPLGPLLHSNTPLMLNTSSWDRTESCPNGVCPAR
jgi:Flp pilus assembly protein TadG